jgi:hypothetical protein
MSLEDIRFTPQILTIKYEKELILHSAGTKKFEKLVQQ